MADMLRRFLNSEGQLVQWPAKQANQQLVLVYLADKFETERPYSESEINKVLRQWHTYGDWATLRRALVDAGLFRRKNDGSEYHRASLQNP